MLTFIANRARAFSVLLLLAMAGCGGGDWPEHEADTMPVICVEKPGACT